VTTKIYYIRWIN